MSTRKLIYVIVVAALLLVLAIFGWQPFLMQKSITMIYPFDRSLFPADFATPTFKWLDPSGAAQWHVSLRFQDQGSIIETISNTPEWKPDRPQWENIKKRSLARLVTVTVRGRALRWGVSGAVSSGQVTFTTSHDSVSAPIFFRAVTLPFEFAVHHMETLKWCLGDISVDGPPKIVLENMPVCANCHSFARDGKTLAMDVDYANDKGSYAITDIAKEIVLSNDKVITWSEYKREDKDLTFGLLSQISPDGRYAISTVKDRSVFVPKNDKYYSQLFFPLKGILAYYDRDTRIITELEGADDKAYVQSNPAWSPDGKEIVFAKSKLGKIENWGDKVLLSQEQCKKYLDGEEDFKFDLYRIPFNNGSGGTATPIPGAFNNGLSNYFARYSPDGKWIVFCQSKNFMLLQPDSKLYIIPAQGGPPRKMNCNTEQMNSWHSWSPNGKWLVFSTKMFSPYTQLLLTHIDDDGNDSVPVLLENLTLPDRAVNIPEFVNIRPDAIGKIKEAFINYYSYKRMAYEKIGDDNTAAEKLLEKSIELNPHYATTHNLLGTLLRDMKRLDEAEKEFKSAVQLSPDDPVFYNNLGAIYLEKRQFNKAQASFETALRFSPQNLPAHEGIAESYLQEGNLTKAQFYFENAIKIEPKKLSLLMYLGRIYAAKNDFQRATTAFETAQRLDPKSPTIYNSLATVYLNQKQFEKARDAFENALSFDNTYAPAYEGLGEIYLATNDTLKAQACFEKAIQLDPQYPFTYKELGRILAVKKEFNRAAQLLLTATKLDPEDADSFNELGKLYFNHQDYGAAEQAFRTVLALDANNASACLMLARVISGDSKRLQEAIALCTRSQRLTLSPQACVELGNLYIRVGDKAKAVAQFEKALALDPTAEGLREHIQKIRQTR